jgi:hypothetical protein
MLLPIGRSASIDNPVQHDARIDQIDGIGVQYSLMG